MQTWIVLILDDRSRYSIGVRFDGKWSASVVEVIRGGTVKPKVILDTLALGDGTLSVVVPRSAMDLQSVNGKVHIAAETSTRLGPEHDDLIVKLGSEWLTVS